MALFEHTNNTTQQGNIGLSRAIYEFSRLGYAILVPLTDSNEYDLVIEKDGVFARVQCKTSSTTYKNQFVINLLKIDKKQNVHKRATKYDWLFVLTSDDECFFIPHRRVNLPQRSSTNSKFSQYRLT